MKKITTKRSRARAAALTERNLAHVIGGTDGTVIVESLLAAPRGIEGTGRT